MIQLSPFQNEKGMALVLVLMVSAVLLTSLLAGYTIMASALKTTAIEISRDQVMSVALAGVEDVLAWFRTTAGGKSAVKLMFDPLNAGATRGTTQILIPETQDASIGLVRDFPIGLMNGLYGRYEVWDNKPPNPLTGTPNPNKLDAACYNALPAQDKATATGVCGVRVQDLTSQKLPGSTNRGAVWRIEVDAYIYQRNNPNVAYNQSPNRILGNVTMGMELRRMALNAPRAALTTYRASNVQVHAQGVIRSNEGGVAGVLVKNNPGNNGVTGQGTVSGYPAVQFGTITSDAQFDATVDPVSVFGMSFAELKTFVQNSSNGIYVSNSADFNSKLVPYPSNAANPPLVYIEGGAGFATATINLFNTTLNAPINAYGILVVEGVNLNMVGGPSGCTTSNCGQFTGLVYTSGTLSINGGAIISGAVVATHRNQGGGGSQSIQIGNATVPQTRIIYNGSYITSVLNQLTGNYSISRTPHIIRR